MTEKPTKPVKKELKKPLTKILESGEHNGAEQHGGEMQSAALGSKEDIKNFLLTIRDRMQDDGVSAVHALSAINYVLNSGDGCRLIDNEGKEIARDIFLRIKQAGLQVKSPSLLFQE